MKSIKNKLCKIVVATAMILSGCFLTQTVEAVDNTGDTSNSYFANENLIVSSNEIEGNNSITIPSESHVSEDDNGSNLVGNEGEVWTAKKIDKIDDHGGYKITFYARGFKYRNVDEDNIKEDDNWKNPLAAGTTLTFTENLPVDTSKDKFTFNAELTVAKSVGLEDKGDIVLATDNSGNYTVSFDANDVIIDNTEGGIAFDIEVSFNVSLNSDINVGTYKTNTAEAKFTPATDNYYYYEWGTHVSTETYYFYGFKWRNASADGFEKLQLIGNIELPGDNGKENSLIFSIKNSQGGNPYNVNNPIDPSDSKFQQYSNGYPEGTPQKEENYQYWINVKDQLIKQNNYDVEQNGISEIYLYLNRDNAQYDFRIEVKYLDDTWKIFTPTNPIPSQGGCDPEKPWGLSETIIIQKENSELRDEYEQYETDTEGELSTPFSNFAEITLILPTVDNVSTKKTATLLNWDDRTYRIDLFAASNLAQQSKPADIVFALDLSGSMPWLVEKPQTTISFNDLDTQENRNKYNINSETNSGTISKWVTFDYFVLDDGEYKPIGYFDEDNAPEKDKDNTTEKYGEGWYALKSKGRKSNENSDEAGDIVYNNLVKVDENTEIYVKGNTKTKIEELLTQTQSFIDALAVSSSDSTIGFSLYAGTLLGEKSLTSVSELTGTGVNDFVGSIKLEGNTSQGVGIQKAQYLLNSGTNENKIIILFTDGKEARPSYISVSADNASKEAKDAGIKIYSIGLASEDVLNTSGDGETSLADKLESWSSGEGYYYAVSNYTAFEEAFSSIFNDFVGSIKNVTIVDTIDSRFTIPSDEVERLNKIEGVTATESSVTWQIDELRYVENVEDGQHLYIDIKAKDDFLGGNYIPTNVPSSSTVSVGGTSKELDKPVVNVKTNNLTLQDDEKTYFLGENINPGDFINHLLNGIISLNDEQKNKLSNGETLEIDYSYGTNGDNVGKFVLNYEAITDEGKVSNLTLHEAVQEGQGVEQYKLNLEYVPTPVQDRQTKMTGYQYTDVESFINSTHENCNHTTDETLNGKIHIALETSDEGIYNVHVVSGSITINKTINEMTDNDTQGDPIFTFHITGETVSGDEVNEYRSVRFEKNDGMNKFVATIDGLEKGEYTITELDTLRYEFNSVSINSDDNVDYTLDGKNIKCFIGHNSRTDNTTNIDHRNISVTYSNDLSKKDDQSDTDIVTNSFKVNENGQIEISANYYTKTNED